MGQRTSQSSQVGSQRSATVQATEAKPCSLSMSHTDRGRGPAVITYDSVSAGPLLLFYAPVGMCRGRHCRSNAKGQTTKTAKNVGPSFRRLCCTVRACLGIDLISPGESEPIIMQGVVKRQQDEVNTGLQPLGLKQSLGHHHSLYMLTSPAPS